MQSCAKNVTFSIFLIDYMEWARIGADISANTAKFNAYQRTMGAMFALFSRCGLGSSWGSGPSYHMG